MVIVDEEKPVPADSELVLVLDDWRLDAKGQIVDDFDHPADVLRQGRLGAVGGVNARARPAALAFPPGSRLRLRLVNAATARIMQLRLPGGGLNVIALDGQFCDPFEPQGRLLPLGPGARCDLLLDLAPVENQDFKIVLVGEAELPDAALFEILTKGAARNARRLSRRSRRSICCCRRTSSWKRPKNSISSSPAARPGPRRPATSRPATP